MKKEGGLWDSSLGMYGGLARPRLDNLTWTFGNGTKVSFGHLEHETTVLSWQGGQIALLCFDELTHFTKHQFFYMLSRNRSTCGVRPYIRATTNPDADSWVAEFIAWWIDQNTGSPIPERAGKLRWFARVGDELRWADTAEKLRADYPGSEPKSVTFIPARLDDNKILMAADPGYRANLMAMGRVERERLLGGNWKIRPSAGLLFQRRWCEMVDVIPAGTRSVRGYDLASTPKTENNDPDQTASVKIGCMPDGRFIVAHAYAMFAGPSEVERSIINTANEEGRAVQIALPQDPGQAGKSQVAAFTKKLAGFTVSSKPVTGDKVTRFSPFSAQAGAGNVVVLRGEWNTAWFDALEGFPDARYDDLPDATSEAFDLLTTGPYVAQITKEYSSYIRSKLSKVRR